MAVQRLNLQAYNYSILQFARPGENRDDWVLDPPYQRGSVWTDQQRVALVWSLLRGIPIGSIYINVRDPGHDAYDLRNVAAVVDGKQRIETARKFIDSEFVVPATWFGPDEYSEKHGPYLTGDTTGTVTWRGEAVPAVLFNQLTKHGQNLFSRATVSVCEACVDTVAEEAELYLLINFGGVDQTEIDRLRAESAAGK